MSVHFSVSEFLNAILHRHTDEPDLPQLSEQQLLLIDCYRSGQIEESAWQEHLDEDSDLAAYFREPVAKASVH
jgi:hypothetical protein